MNTLRPTRMKGWFEYTRQTCPVCGKAGGCIVNEKGDTVACIRTESKTMFSKNSSVPSWIHKLNEKVHVETSKRGDFVTHEKTYELLLDRVYQALVHCSTLTDDHITHLTGASRMLNMQQIKARQYISFPKKPWETVKQISSLIGFKKYPGFPGFYKNDFGWSLNGWDGIMIPYRNVRNEIIGFQIRVDNPKNDVEMEKNKFPSLNARVKEQPNLVQISVDGEIVSERRMELKEVQTVEHEGLTGSVKLVKGQRYFWLSSANRNEGTGSGNPTPVHVAVPTVQLEDWDSTRKADSVWITEGALKADIAVDHLSKVYTKEQIAELGDTFLATAGVNSWRLLLPILEEMEVKNVNVAFDMDVLNNPTVASHTKELIVELKAKGYSVTMALWNDEDGKGIDDLFTQKRSPKLQRL